MTAASSHTIHPPRRPVRGDCAGWARRAGRVAPRWSPRPRSRRPATRLEQSRAAAAARRAARGAARARRPGAAAGGLHHRQPGAPRGRPAGHDARARIAPHRRQGGRRRHDRRRRGVGPHARSCSTSTSCSRTRRASKATPSIVTLGARAPGQRAAAAPAARRRPPPRRRGRAASRSIEKVDFRRGTDGAGRIIVRTQRSANVQASLKQEGGRIVVDFPRTTRRRGPVAPLRRRRFRDAGQLVRRGRARLRGARIVVAATGDFEQLAYQTDREYVLEVRPRAKAAVADPAQEGIQGRAPDAQLPGHRDARGAAAAGRDQRPEHRGQRHGAGQRHAAPAERAVGPGARHRAAHQGPRQAPGRQRHLRRARPRSWRRARSSCSSRRSR